MTHPEYVLRGSEYVPKKLLKKSPVPALWEEIPESLRVTEDRIRRGWGASDPKWLARHLSWHGCPVAVQFSYPLWRRCHYQVQSNGYCKPHAKRAEVIK